MKKYTILMLVVFLIFTFCSCGRSEKDNTDISSANLDYTDIECEKYDKFEYTYFSDKENSKILRINMPKKWNFEKSEQGYNIVEFSEVIGNITICDEFVSENNGQCVSETEIDAVDVFVMHTINKFQVDKDVSYSHTFIYKYEDINGSKNIVINLPYEKVSIDTASKMMNHTNLEKPARDEYLGVLRIKDNRKRILIMGNSFINSSEIGDTLQKMCGSSIIVDAYSRGYAEVRTYANDTIMMNEIESGKYSAVFICGFYSPENVTALNTIVNVCKNSGTKLAIFPAHNENRSVITAACAQYEYPVLIDWKAEIDRFMQNGIEKSFFCVNDMHFHSTAIAGYIGAHMIYRALFGKTPVESYKYNHVSQKQIDRLGEYKSTGFIVPAYSNNICYFN